MDGFERSGKNILTRRANHRHDSSITQFEDLTVSTGVCRSGPDTEPPLPFPQAAMPIPIGETTA
jgi:hypothetical protein